MTSPLSPATLLFRLSLCKKWVHCCRAACCRPPQAGSNFGLQRQWQLREHSRIHLRIEQGLHRSYSELQFAVAEPPAVRGMQAGELLTSCIEGI